MCWLNGDSSGWFRKESKCLLCIMRVVLELGTCELPREEECIVAPLILRKAMGSLAFGTDRLEGRNENPAIKCKPSTEQLTKQCHPRINEAAGTSKIIAH